MSSLERIVGLLERDFDVKREALVPAATLESLDIDSLRMIEILFCVEEELGISVPADPGELRARVKTLGDLAQYLDTLPPQPGKAGT